MKLHLGCGQYRFDGYLNVDFPASEHTVPSVWPISMPISRLCAIRLPRWRKCGCTTSSSISPARRRWPWWQPGRRGSRPGACCGSRFLISNGPPGGRFRGGSDGASDERHCAICMARTRHRGRCIGRAGPRHRCGSSSQERDSAPSRWSDLPGALWTTSQSRRAGPPLRQIAEPANRPSHDCSRTISSMAALPNAASMGCG